MHIPVPWVIWEHDYTVNVWLFLPKEDIILGRTYLKKHFRATIILRVFEHYKVQTLPIFAINSPTLALPGPSPDLMFLKVNHVQLLCHLALKHGKIVASQKDHWINPQLCCSFINCHWGHLGYLNPPKWN